MPEEIAETLGMPVATVKSNLQRGLEMHGIANYGHEAAPGARANR